MAKELTDQEMNEHMDDYEEVSISKDNEVWPTMELKLTVTHKFQLDFHFCVDLRCLFIVLCGYKIGRHLGHALFSTFFR